jgi:hypothetical protein
MLHCVNLNDHSLTLMQIYRGSNLVCLLFSFDTDGIVNHVIWLHLPSSGARIYNRSSILAIAREHGISCRKSTGFA